MSFLIIDQSFGRFWGLLDNTALHPADFTCCELIFNFCDLESADFWQMELKDLIWPNTGSKPNKTPHNNI